MHTAKQFPANHAIRWSWRQWAFPLVYATVVVGAYEILEFRTIGIPTLPMSLVGIAVAFFLGFKNNASYDRLWEGRKIWGAIVNASRSWAYGARDLIGWHEGEVTPEAEATAAHRELIHRHVAWMDALRHQLRQVKSWEHDSERENERRRREKVPEYLENLRDVLIVNIDEVEADEALSQINPAAFLIAKQSSRLNDFRRAGYMDGFAHMHLQEVLQELMAQQGKAERIKNFPFPRQYATVNSLFARLLVGMLPFGLLPEFVEFGEHMIWLVVPFSTVVSWVFLTTDLIGDFSENPFEGLVNDVPISSMSRGIERDILQMLGEKDLPESRPLSGMTQY